MMIHDKPVSRQFLLDFKNDRSGLLQAAAVAQHHHPQILHHLQPLTPPMAPLDIYSAYAYHQQLQQQLLHSAVPQHLPGAGQSPQTPEVLDLSRRDSVDYSRKTPSPYQTNSRFCSRSPTASPNGLLTTQQQPTSPLLSVNLLYAAQNTNGSNIPSNLTALYPSLYYQNSAFKQEPMSITPPPLVSVPNNSSEVKRKNSVLETLPSAAIVTATTSAPHDTSESNTPQQSPQPKIATPASTGNKSSLAALDPKNTRPFKSFPRDPLVIAANFAATDVLLDNPRVERYTEYRKRVLEQLRRSNGGSRTVTNPKMRRTNSSSGSIHEGSSSNTSENDERHHEESSDCESNAGNDNQATTLNIKNPECSSTTSTTNNTNTTTTSTSGGIVKDAAYYERRRKNNAAAKKSRDRRRIKEDEIAMRASYLERQNIELLCQIEALKAQLAALTSKMSQN